MGCRSDYLAPTAREIESSRLIKLLKECGLYGNDAPYYGETDKVDAHTKSLCEFCQVNDVSNYSLELQLWWRDHKIADEKRLKLDASLVKVKKDRDELISKLSEYERNLLGL